MGHVKYRKFESKYSLHSVGVIDSLQERAKQMESDLEEWRRTVEDLRSKYYHMNYFTTRQLSLICQELSTLHTVTHLTFKPWFLNLMQSVCPSLNIDQLATATVRVVEERNRMKMSSFFSIADHDNFLTLEESNGDEEPQHAVSKDERMYTPQRLKLEDLNDTQQEMLEELREFDFSDELILIALTEKGCSFDDLYDYCLKFSSMDVDPGLEEPCTVEPAIVVREAEPEELPLDENHPLVKDMIENGFDVELAIEAAEVCECNWEQTFDYCLEKGMISGNQEKEIQEYR